MAIAARCGRRYTSLMLMECFCSVSDVSCSNNYPYQLYNTRRTHPLHNRAPFSKLHTLCLYGPTLTLVWVGEHVAAFSFSVSNASGPASRYYASRMPVTVRLKGWLAGWLNSKHSDCRVCAHTAACRKPEANAIRGATAAVCGGKMPDWITSSGCCNFRFLEMTLAILQEQPGSVGLGRVGCACTDSGFQAERAEWRSGVSKQTAWPNHGQRCELAV
jgi:hypothetical protein